MGDVTIGLLHPGEMGAAVGQCLAGAGHQVLWVPEGRSAATRERADAAGLAGCGLAEMAARSDVIVSVCPPAAALDVARLVAGSAASTWMPTRSRRPPRVRWRRIVTAGGASYVDGGIIGHSPGGAGVHPAVPVGSARRGGPGAVRRHRGGRAAGRAAGHGVRGEDGVRVLDQGIGRAAAGGAGAGPGRGRRVRPARGVGHLPARPGEALGRADGSAAAKGWRWVGEMEEIAAAMAAAGLPEGFHQAAAEIYRRY